MTLSNIRATLGLNATATLGAAGTSGSVSLGQSNRTLSLTSVNSGYSNQVVFANNGDATTLNLMENSFSSTTAWVAGVAQVETATAAGSVSTSGNMTCTVTSTGMTGSPLAVSIAVTNGDTAATWAGKVRTALAANATIAERFTVSGSSTAIVLTRKPSHTFTVPGGTLPIYLANDSSLNIALANDTSSGITTASTSTNTIAGTASDGVKIYDGDGKDLEGNTIFLNDIYGIIILLTADGSTCSMVGSVNDIQSLASNELYAKSSPTGVDVDASQTFTAGAACSLAITVFGA